MPGIKLPAEYPPWEFVVAVMIWPVGPVTVTFAPWTTAPEVSVTVPTILPVEMVVWAKAAAVSSANVANRANRKLNRMQAREGLRFRIFDHPYGMFTDPEFIFANQQTRLLVMTTEEKKAMTLSEVN